MFSQSIQFDPVLFLFISETFHRNSVPRRVDMSEKEMRTFISQLIQEGEQWKSMKMVVLGNGRIGKTTLLRTFDKLLDPSSIHVCSLSIFFLFFNF